MNQSVCAEFVDDTVTSSEDAGSRLECGQRLSQSMLWELQRSFFERRGVEAWRESMVPHYITSNAFIAHAYVRVVFGFLRDCRGGAGEVASGVSTPEDRDEPIYIIEMGCGSGRFAHHFLVKFRQLHRQSALKHVPFKYIMTDYSERNVAFWCSHESLKPFVEDGLLDFARFDPLQESELKLVGSGETLSADTIRNPMVFIANYFFDSIPMDAFYFKDGRLHESLVSVSSSQPEPDRNDPEILSRMSVDYEHVPVEGDYYDNPEWNRILHYYTRRLSDTTLLFPTGALECIHNCARLAGGRMLFLSADRGACRLDELVGCEQPGLAVHGSFSLPVNYHAIGQYVANEGGTSLQPAYRSSSLIVSALLFGDAPGDYTETRQAYEEAVNAVGPDDFYTLKNAIQGVCDGFDLDQLLAFLRLSSYDAKMFMSCFGAMRRHLEDATETEKVEVIAALRHVAETYYPIGDEPDALYHIGWLFGELGHYEEALRCLEESVRLYGSAVGTDYNLAVCLQNLGELEKALVCLDRALESQPDFEEARTLRSEIESAMAARRQPVLERATEPLAERCAG